MKLTLIIFSFVLLSCSSSSLIRVRKFSGKDHFNKSIEVNPSLKKHTAVIFLSSVCPCSSSHVELLREMNSQYRDVQFVAIHSNFYEDLHKAQYYFAKSKLGFPVIYDSETKLAKEFRALSTPHVFILNQKGEIEYSGAITSSSNALKAKENYLAVVIEKLQRKEIISTKFRKPFGCKIVTK